MIRADGNSTFIAAAISRFEVTTKKKPFDFFVQRLPLKKSRGDRTPIELFRPLISVIKGDVAGLIRDATPYFISVYEPKAAT